jgi:hypothetical protein
MDEVRDEGTVDNRRAEVLLKRVKGREVGRVSRIR